LVGLVIATFFSSLNNLEGLAVATIVCSSQLF
jgi:hypothetical protein